MATVEERVSRVEGNLEQINARLANLEANLIELRREMIANFRRIIGAIIAMWVTIMGAIAGLFNILLTRFTP